MIDGKAAALAVRELFEEIHGVYSVVGFQLIDIKKNEGENYWEVSCLFYPGLGARTQSTYKVKVDLEDGSILDQEKIEQE